MIGIIMIIILCVSIAALILSILAYMKSYKNSKIPSTMFNQTGSNLVQIPLTRMTSSGAANYDLKSDGYHIFITQISNLKPNCPVRLKFNDLQINLPVNNDGIAYPGGKKGQPLMLSLMPDNIIRLISQSSWDQIPIGTFSSLKVTDVLPDNNPKKLGLLLVESQDCNYSQSDIVTRYATIQNGSFGLDIPNY